MDYALPSIEVDVEDVQNHEVLELLINIFPDFEKWEYRMDPHLEPNRRRVAQFFPEFEGVKSKVDLAHRFPNHGRMPPLDVVLPDDLR